MLISLSFKTLIPAKSVKLVRMQHLIELILSKSGLFIQHDLLFHLCSLFSNSTGKITKVFITNVNLVSLLITGHYIPLISRVFGLYYKLRTEFFPSIYDPSAKRAGHKSMEKNEDP